MQKSNKRMIAIILTAVLALSLMLTACNKGGDNPTGDNSTPGTSSTPEGTGTPGGSSTPDTSAPQATPKYKMPSYDKEHKTFIDNEIARLGGIAKIDIENVLDKAYEKYGQYLNVNISKDAVKAGIINRDMSPYVHGKAPEINITGISPNAVAKVNDFLVNNGKEPIGITDPALLKAHNELLAGMHMEPVPAILTPEENITAFWLAASLYYDPAYDGGSIRPCLDITFAMAQAMADPSKPDDFIQISDYIWSDYAKLYGTFDDYGAAIVLNP